MFDLNRNERGEDKYYLGKKEEEIELNIEKLKKTGSFTLRKGITKGLKGKLVASWSREWNSSMVTVEF